jgi:hypothetical protein
MNAVVITSFKTSKAAHNYAADLASHEDGQYWNGREHVQIGSLNYRAVKNDGEWLVVRDSTIRDTDPQIRTITL